MTHPSQPGFSDGQTHSPVCLPAALGAKLVDFGGWDMSPHYGSQLDEHHRVRRAAGLFDVSHMTIVDFAEPAVRPPRPPPDRLNPSFSEALL